MHLCIRRVSLSVEVFPIFLQEICAEKTGMRLYLYRGISNKHIQSLIYYSQSDQAIKNFTSDSKRFASKESFEAWQNQGRTIYTLQTNTESLAGIIWFGEKNIEKLHVKDSQYDIDGYGITFAIRTYDNARGSGIAFPFMQSVFHDFVNSETYAIGAQRGIWLDTKSDNTSAIGLYKKFGFIEVGNTDHDSIVMIIPQLHIETLKR